MSVKDDYEGKINTYGDSTPRLMRQLKGENDSLYKEFTKLQEKHGKTKENLSKLQVSYSNLEKELSLTKTNQKKIMTQKQQVEKELLDTKEYARKLEQKIKSGLRTVNLVDTNLQLTNKLQELRQEKQENCLRIQQLESDVAGYQSKLKILTQICESKAADFGIYCENPSEVILNLATSNELIIKLKQVSSELKEKFEEAEYKVEELQIVRDSNNEELNRLEEENFSLKNEISQLSKANKDLAIDRNALLQCLEEMSGQQKQYEMDIENFAAQIEKNSVFYSGQIKVLEKEIGFKDEIIRKRNNKESEDSNELKFKLEKFQNLEKENGELRVKVKKLSVEFEECKKEFEVRENRLKMKLASCFKEFEKVLKEKEEIQNALNKVSQVKIKVSKEDRPRQIDDTLLLLNAAKQKNLDLLNLMSNKY